MTAAELKAALLSMRGQDRPAVRVPTPEWAPFGLAEVWHDTPTPDDRDWYDQRDGELRYRYDDIGQKLPADLRGLRAETVARLLCTSSGERLAFEPLEVIELRRLNAAAMDRVFYSIQKTGGWLPSAVDDAKKNSAPSPGDGSCGDSSSPPDDSPPKSPPT